MTEPQTFAVELCQMTGLTYRQLDYWARRLGFKRRGSGYHHPYLPYQVDAFVRLTDLLKRQQSEREAFFAEWPVQMGSNEAARIHQRGQT